MIAGLLFIGGAAPRRRRGLTAAEVVTQRGHTSPALLHDNSSHSKGLTQETATLLKNGQRRVNIASFDAPTPGGRDYAAILAKRRTAEPDPIFFNGCFLRPECCCARRPKCAGTRP